MSTRTKTAAVVLAMVLGLAVVVVPRVSGPSSLPDEYLGRWYFAGSGGGIAGDIFEGATGASIVITAGNEIEHYGPDGTFASTETFSLSRGSSIFSADEGWILDADSFMPRVIQASDSALSISDNVYDGFGSWYTRTR